MIRSPFQKTSSGPTAPHCSSAVVPRAREPEQTHLPRLTGRPHSGNTGSQAPPRFMLACASREGIVFRFHAFLKLSLLAGCFPPLPQLHQGPFPAGVTFLVGTTPCSMLLPSSPREELVQRVRGEYREMPSLRLTSSQAQRLFGLEPLTCAAILGALVKEKFLSCTSNGLFVRSDPHVRAFAATRI